MTRNLNRADRIELDDALLSRPGDVDPDTGIRPPPGFSEEELAASARQFSGMTIRRR